MKNVFLILSFLFVAPFLQAEVNGYEADMNPENILWVSPEMKSFLDAKFEKKRSSTKRMNKLLSYIVSPDGLGFQYDKEITLTASEGFAQRRGNCVTFAFLYASLAREVGLKVHFNRVITQPKFNTKEMIIVELGHTNILVDLGDDFYVVDLIATYRDNVLGTKQIVSDEFAFADYYNNLAVDETSMGHFDKAIPLFEKALELESMNYGVLRNLGLLYRILEDYDPAEKYLLLASEGNDKSSLTYFILSNFYEEIGEAEKAEFYQKKAKHYRRLNPFFYYAEAIQFMEVEDWENAAKKIKKAIRLGDKCHFLYYDLAMVYERLGEKEEMVKALKKAIRYASNDSVEERYQMTFEAVVDRYLEDGSAFGKYVVVRE